MTMKRGWRGLRWVTGVVCVFSAATSNAGDAAWSEALVTDRPDVAEASETVGHLRLQIETGVSVGYDKTQDERSVAWRSPTKIRFGITEVFELHVETGGFAYDVLDTSGQPREYVDGSEDLEFGFKYRLVQGFDNEQPWLPSVGLLGAVESPTGTHVHRSPGLTPTVVFALDWELTADLALGVNVGASVPHDEDEHRLVQGLFAAAMWYGVTDRLGVYGEIFGDVPDADRSQTMVAVDGGGAFLITPDVQVDVSVSVGLTRVAENLGCGLGLSLRF